MSKSSEKIEFNEEEIDFIKTCAKQCLPFVGSSNIEEDFLLDLILKCKKLEKKIKNGN